MKRRQRFSTLFFLIVAFIFITGIKSDNDLIELIKKYPSDDAIILNSDIKITFYSNRNKLPYIIIDEKSVFQSLKPKKTISKSYYYDNYSEIQYDHFVKTSPDAYLTDKICGNYEIDGIFYSDMKLCSYFINFSNVGSKAELTVRKIINDPKYLSQVFLHENFPVLRKTVQINVPEQIEVDLHEFNFNEFNITCDTVMRKPNLTCIYKAYNLNPLKSEKFEMGITHTYPHILIQAKSYTNDKIKTKIFDDIDDQYKWYHSLISNYKNDSGKISAQVKQLIYGKINDIEKIKAIYYWVQDNIRYCAFENGIAGFKPENPEIVFNKRYGDCKGMSNLTKTMLTFAGYEAHLCWLGTNHLIYDYSFPSLLNDNHMICYLKFNNEELYLDPTESFCPLNEYAERIQGRQVIIENGEEYIISSIPVHTAGYNKEERFLTLSVDQDKLKGKGKIIYQGEIKRILFQMLSMTGKPDHEILVKKIIQGDNPGFTVDSITYTNLYNRDSSLILNFNVVCDYMIFRNRDKIYVEIDPFKDYKNFTIKPDRYSDLNLGYKIYQVTCINLKIPKNYEMVNKSENRDLTFKNFCATLRISEENGFINYKKIFETKKSSIDKSEFHDWLNFIASLEDLHNNKIELKQTPYE